MKYAKDFEKSQDGVHHPNITSTMKSDNPINTQWRAGIIPGTRFLTSASITCFIRYIVRSWRREPPEALASKENTYIVKSQPNSDIKRPEAMEKSDGAATPAPTLPGPVRNPYTRRAPATSDASSGQAARTSRPARPEVKDEPSSSLASSALLSQESAAAGPGPASPKAPAVTPHSTRKQPAAGSRPPPPSSLTPAQRARIAESRRLASERRERARSQSSPLSAEQRARIEGNRRRALERRVEGLVRSEPNKRARLALAAGGSGGGPCARCGSADPDSLCVIWEHRGDICRERSFGRGPYG